MHDNDVSYGCSKPYFSSFRFYQTSTRLYVVGCESAEETYRILKFDRTVAPPKWGGTYPPAGEENLVPQYLVVTDDRIQYNSKQINVLLRMLDESNPNTVRLPLECCALLGAVRFYDGYYLVAVVHQTSVSQVAHAAIRRVDEAVLIPVLNPYLQIGVADYRRHPDEDRHVEAFRAFLRHQDLYYSLEYNLTIPIQAWLHPGAPRSSHSMYTWNSSWLLPTLQPPLQQSVLQPRGYPWFVPVIYGHVGHARIASGLASGSMPGLAHDGRPGGPPGPDASASALWAAGGSGGGATGHAREMRMTLIARRSRLMAGTRYLRRGVDPHGRGYVANEVETEHILHAVGETQLRRVIAFVQHRGSVPTFWEQNGTSKMPKPEIKLTVPDPFHRAANAHFNRLLSFYGRPCVVFSLVKPNSPREHKLQAALVAAIETRRAFSRALRKKGPSAAATLKKNLQPQQDKKIVCKNDEDVLFEWLDVSGAARDKSHSLIPRLWTQAMRIVSKIGCYDGRQRQHTTSDEQPVASQQSEPPASAAKYWDIGADPLSAPDFLQHGVVRTNCVDCLDRTNLAAYVLALCSLSACGVALESTRAVEALFEAHGDALAVQYAGSNLVNTVATYTRSGLVSQSRDMIETVRRYYSNSFTDNVRQEHLDIVLGLHQSYAISLRSQVDLPSVPNVAFCSCSSLSYMPLDISFDSIDIFLSEKLRTLNDWWFGVVDHTKIPSSSSNAESQRQQIISRELDVKYHGMKPSKNEIDFSVDIKNKATYQSFLDFDIKNMMNSSYSVSRREEFVTSFASGFKNNIPQVSEKDMETYKFHLAGFQNKKNSQYSINPFSCWKMEFSEPKMSRTRL